jgi:hypothetical protein
MDNYIGLDGSMKETAVSIRRGAQARRVQVDRRPALQAAINRFLAETNDAPRPFTWTSDPDKIIAAVRRGHKPRT